MKNIILVGLKGTNKSEIGKELAHRLKMKLIDTDDIMKRDSGLDLPELLKKVGEKKFRFLENSIIEEISNVSDTVIVVGSVSINIFFNANIRAFLLVGSSVKILKSGLSF
ncbi:Shikimate kinase [subsurface metagenome]